SVVDEFTAHRLLEYSNKPCTSNDLRQFTERISKGSGARRISLAELLAFYFGYDWQKLANKPECRDILAERDARDELEKAKAELNKLTGAAKHAAIAAEEAHQSEAKALRQELAASKAAENAKAAKIALDETKDRTDSMLEALKLQEEATQRKMDMLESIAADGSKGIVSRNKAKTELAILLNEDPITLRTARIQQEAASKKTTVAAKKAEQTVVLSETALERATHARKESIRLKESSLAATKKAEEAIPSAQVAFDKISKTLDEIMKKQNTGKGTLYFIQCDLNQSRKYLPKSRFVVAQKRADELVQLAESSS
ncbi:hypothetical protein ACHAXR_004772, partial [Thalassiosira sp. AJA248-18]